MNYREYDDSELLSYIEEDNEDAYNIIYEKYKPLIIKTVKRMSSVVKGTGIDSNDLVQEGMIGLSRAIKHYNDHLDTSFYTYAKKCIESNIISSIIREKKQHNKALNESLSLDDNYGKENDLVYEDLFTDDRFDPEKSFINEENAQEIIKKAHEELTPLEVQVFDLKINGFDNDTIASILDKDYKSIDNALQRIKTKLKETRS